MYALESPDANVALRMVYANRHGQSGESLTTTPGQRPAKPYERPRAQKARQTQAIQGIPSLGAGAFWKDVEVRRREDGTVIAVRSDSDAGIGFERVGRTIHGRGKPTRSTRAMKKEGQTGQRARTEIAYMDPSLRRLAEVEREEDASLSKGPVYMDLAGSDVFWAGAGQLGDEWAAGERGRWGANSERAGDLGGDRAGLEGAAEEIFEMYVKWADEE